MRILIDIGHPGHVHLFKQLAHLLMEEGAEVLFTAREKEFELELLRFEGFNYKSFGKHYRRFLGKIWGLVKFDLKMWLVARRFNPDLLISHGSVYAAHASFLLGKKHLALEDSGNMEQIILYRPFTDLILTPEVLPEDLGPKQVRYRGYHEIAYLHPEFFRPDASVFTSLGLKPHTEYAIIRLVSWQATHDAGQRGLSGNDKIKLARKLSRQMKVFISSEAELPPELAPYRIKIAPEKLHDALYFARIVISEGATIASESGVLGTPAVYINSISRSYCQDQEKYGLVFNTCISVEVFNLIDEILMVSREEFKKRKDRLLEEKVNVTRFLHQFITDRYFNQKVDWPVENKINRISHG